MNDADLLNSGLSRGQIDVIWHVFGSHPKIAKVLLYGSRAKGNYRENSDIDLTSPSLQTFRSVGKECSRATPRSSRPLGHLHCTYSARARSRPQSAS
ncbi:MAG: nucleotidyltransferase domain-containing protein [Coxiellaceae bacterium]|nr:nucleotidyltransferase domain-containing protein [Coxiellaceae bacterium]